jgi:hypothetical protein
MKPDPASLGEKRRAALTLHALHADDRDWVLSQLGRPQRVELEALLAELTELGIPRDPELVNTALAASQPELLAKQAPKVSLQAESKALAKLLSAEPDAIAMHCLALLDETQRVEVTSLLMGDKRVRLKSAAPVTAAPALTAAIAQLVTAKLAAQTTTESRA